MVERGIPVSTQTAPSGFKPGDVVRYNPAQHHCREGTAIAHDRGLKGVVLLDTFWGGLYSDQHVPSPDELVGAEVLFNLNDYDELDRYARHMSDATWHKYASSDREVVTSQHGLQKRWFIRKGAEPDWATQIENARREVEEREQESQYAQRRLEWAREDLARVIAKAAEETVGEY